MSWNTEQARPDDDDDDDYSLTLKLGQLILFWEVMYELHELATFSIVLSVQWPFKVEVSLVLSYISETLHVIF